MLLGKRLAGIVLACLFVGLGAASARAAERYWVGASGDWNDPANWSATEGGPGGASVPGDGDEAHIEPTDALDRTINYSLGGAPAPELVELRLYPSVDATGSVTMVKDEDDLNVAGTLGVYSNAVFRHSGGNADIGLIFLPSDGTLELLGGEVRLDHFWIRGQVVQSGGVLDCAGQPLGYGAVNIGSNENAPTGCYTISAGTLHVSELVVGYVGNPPGAFHITDPGVDVMVTTFFAFGTYAEFTAPPGTSIRFVNGYFASYSQQPEKVADLQNVDFIFTDSADDPNAFEVAGSDLGPVFAGFNVNFGLNRLQLGDASDTAKVQLVDKRDNSLADTDPEALYVNELVLGAGSYLDLNGYNIYYKSFTNLGGTIDFSSGGGIFYVPEPAPALMLAVGALTLLRRRCLAVT